MYYKTWAIKKDNFMQISKINSANFKGLWEIRPIGRRWDDKRQCPIFLEDDIYHPFRDETNKEVEAVMTQARKNSVYKYQNGRVNTPFVTVIKYKEGDRLNITKLQYSMIRDMREMPNPQDEHFKPLDANPSSFIRYGK